MRCNEKASVVGRIYLIEALSIDGLDGDLVAGLRRYRGCYAQ